MGLLRGRDRPVPAVEDLNNDENRLPSTFQFGSHVGVGLKLNGRHDAAVGIAYQHLSNAGIKQPNGGIDLYMVTMSFPLR